MLRYILILCSALRTRNSLHSLTKVSEVTKTGARHYLRELLDVVPPIRARYYMYTVK